MTGKRILVRGLVAVLAVLVAGAGVWAWRSARRAQVLARPIPAELTDIAPVRLARPDALIVSRAMKDLPRDLLRVPLLKAVLTEDFVYYYEENEGTLGLKGLLRRLAYEHRLSLGDELVAMVLDYPGDVALWRGPDGKLRHWLIAATRSDAMKLAQLAAEVGSDSQLTKVGTLPAADGAVPLYRLEHVHGRGLLFATHGDKLLVLSDQALFDGDEFGSDADKAPVWKALLDARWPASPLRRHFGLGEFVGKHALVIGADALSFNYRQLFPDIEALRFDFDGSNWSSWLRLDGAPDFAARFDTRALWSAAPAGAALCAAAPVRWSGLKPVLEHAAAADAPIAPALFDAFGGTAAACWYAEGGLYQPLILVPWHGSAADVQALDALFRRSIGGAAAGEVEGDAQTRRWQRALDTDLGPVEVAMAQRGDWLLFSPDAGLVDAALAVQAKQRPALADTLPSDGGTVAMVLNPAVLSRLLRRVVEGDLPAAREPLFHDAAQTLLVPRLEALGAFPPYALRLPAGLDAHQRAWQPVQWQSLPVSP